LCITGSADWSDEQTDNTVINRDKPYAGFSMHSEADGSRLSLTHDIGVKKLKR